MRLVETAVLQIELHEEGPPDGQPLLLLHGWPDAPRGWRPVAGRLHESGWRTIVPALRGSGATRFRSPDAPRDVFEPSDWTGGDLPAGPGTPWKPGFMAGFHLMLDQLNRYLGGGRIASHRAFHKLTVIPGAERSEAARNL